MVRVTVDLKPDIGKLGVRQEFTMNEVPVSLSVI